MNTKGIVAILTLTATLLGLAFVPTAEAARTGNGPRSSDMLLRYFADETSLYAAVKAGQVDWSLWEATAAQYNDAIQDPNIVLAPVSRLDMRAFSLNNNETIAALPNRRSVTSDANFRKSLWCMVDRAYYTQVICGGFATPVYVMISAPSRSWVNVTAESYTQTQYAYNIQTANNYLNAGGFAQRVGDTNPYYNPNVPGSAQYYRGYPAGWPNAGQRIDPVVFSARVDDGLRYAAGTHLRDGMLMSGIPVNFISETSSGAFPRVMTARNYQIYTAGWSTGRFATYSWSWYHTDRWVSGGSNYHIGRVGTTLTSPGYTPATQPDRRPEDLTDVDYWASKVWYPPSLDQAVYAAKMVQGLTTQKYATFIPLWGGRAFFYYRNLFGLTNQDGVGPENTYSFQQAYRADGGLPIRVGHKSPPTQVNQIYSSWVWDVTTMGQTQDGFINLEPFNILNDEPGLAQDWTTAPGGELPAPGWWIDPDLTGPAANKSKMRYYFLQDPTDTTSHTGDSDAEWVRQGTGGGGVLADFTNQWLGGGYEFNSWYFGTEPAGWLYSGYRDIKHIVCNPAGKYADVYFDVASYWSMYWPYGRLIYSDQPASSDHSVLGWKSNPLSEQRTRNFNGPIADGTFLNTLTPTGGDAQIPTRARGTPVEIISMTIDGAPATKATTPHLYNPTTGLGAGGDYSIVGNSLLAGGPRIRIYKDVATSLSVTYWARLDPAGYWPGNTNFQTTLVGTGQYYMTDYLAGAGGYATYKANGHNYMETPPKGEVDFLWNWINTVPATYPRDGAFALDIKDATFTSKSLDSSGNAIPTEFWNPSSDLVDPVGVIDTADVGVMQVEYGKIHNSPYPTPPP